MIVFNKYIQTINPELFQFRSNKYHINGSKVCKKLPILKLDKLYILDKHEVLNVNEIDNTLIISIELEKKILVFTYKGIYNTNSILIKKFIENSIERNQRLKIIPYLLGFKSMFIKNNKPILIANKYNISYFSSPKYFKIHIDLNTFMTKKFINKLIRKDGKLFFALTIETNKYDQQEEDFICLFGIDNLSKFIG